MKIKVIITTIIALFAAVNLLWAQPNWSVNPNEYTYSMTITGQLVSNGYISTDVNDKVAAFIDGECRGVANVKYVSSVNGYFVFLMIYSNTTSATVTFKFYDSSTGEEFDATQTLNFTQNDIVGSVSNPFLISAGGLSSEAKILTFSVPTQVGESIITGNTISLEIPWNGDLSSLAATFTLSEGAKAYVGGVEQVSGVTVNNFSNPVEYTVQSADYSFSTTYEITISLANDIPTDITLSENKKEENSIATFIGYFTAITDDPNETHTFSLVGNTNAENDKFYIYGAGLRTRSPLNYEEKSSYLIYVEADDGRGGVVRKYFTIEVLDVNDAPTNIALINTNTAVNAPANTTIGNLVAVDEDKVDTHTFTLVAGDGSNDEDNNLFYIDGDRLKNKSQLSFLEGIEYHIFVRVVDSGDEHIDVPLVISAESYGNPPHSLTLSNTLVIGIDNPPVFVGTLGVADVDQQTGHVFSLPVNETEGPDNSYFLVVNNNLYLNNPLPVSEKSSYEILIAVTDSMDNQLTKTFTITVKNSLGDGVFYLTNDSLPENQPSNTIVGYFDSETYECTSYSFTLPLEVNLNSYSNNLFDVKGRTLLAGKTFDFEAGNQMLLKVSVTDGETTITQDVPVFLKDENDPPTSINLSTHILSESTELDSEVALLSAEDQDLEDTHTFSLVVGNGVNDESNSMFTISGNKLKLVKPLDYEQKEFHNILIRVTDNRGATFEQSVRLQVADANDAPVFLNKALNYVLQDDVYVYAMDVTDNENDSISIRFNQLPGWLSFNPVSNILSGIPNNDCVGTYNFSIVASDGKKETTQNVILSVINKNDAPEINYYLGTQMFNEKQENEAELPSNCIVDPDGDILKYSLSMENNSELPSWLHFNAETLVISGNPPSGSKGEYNLKLTALDQGNLKCWMVFELMVNFATAIDENEALTKLQIYPNPVVDELSIFIPAGNGKVQVRITNNIGDLVKSYIFQAGSKQTIRFNEPPGMYLVTVQNEDKLDIEKIIKQ